MPMSGYDRSRIIKFVHHHLKYTTNWLIKQPDKALADMKKRVEKKLGYTMAEFFNYGMNSEVYVGEVDGHKVIQGSLF